jgi:hypothetical protein
MKPWVIPSLPQVRVDLDNYAAMDFVHLSTDMGYSDPSDPPRSGHAVWVSADDATPAAIAWEWTILSHGAVAIRDPMTVISNLRFALDDANVLDSTQSAPHLNRLIHDLPWQSHALRAFRRQRHGMTNEGRAIPTRPWAGTGHRLPAGTMA